MQSIPRILVNLLVKLTRMNPKVRGGHGGLPLRAFSRPYLAPCLGGPWGLGSPAARPRRWVLGPRPWDYALSNSANPFGCP